MTVPNLDTRRTCARGVVVSRLPLVHTRSTFRARRGRIRRGLTALLAAVSVVGVGAAAMWGAKLFGHTETTSRALLHTVTRGELLVTVTEDGALESSSNVDVKCEVAGGSTILWIIKDGTQVQSGDELVRLDSSTIEEQIDTQKIAYEKAQAARVQSEKNFSTAKISVQEYLEGTYVKEMQTAESAITVALENLRSSENTFQHTQRMARKGYVTALQREAQAFAVERAKLDLDAAKTTKRVLEKFTKEKMLGDLESTRDTAEAQMRADEAAFDLESTKLKRLNSQLEKCVIKAPKAGMVVYANEQGWRGNQSVTIEEGAAVRERQSLVRLPDLSKMQAKASIHETRVRGISPGMRANVTVQGRKYQGTVVSVANQPEPTGPFSPNVKKYATIVKLNERVADGIPGMTAVVEILVANHPSVLSVPENAVAELDDQYFCWVATGGTVDQRPVKLGLTNGVNIEIVDGLNEGDRVALNPRSIAPDAFKGVKATTTGSMKERFGESKPGEAAPAGAGPAANGPAGEGGGERRRRRSGGGEGGPRSERADTGGAQPTGDSAGGEARPPGSFDPIKMFDKDGDRKLSKDEAPGPMQEHFDDIDQNKDGFVTTKEFAAARSKMGAGGGPPGN